MQDFIYDIESYPNVFTLTAKKVGITQLYIFELSERKNDIVKLLTFIDWMRYHKHRMVGFNNIGYDYPIIHDLLMWVSDYILSSENAPSGSLLASKINEKSKHIINTTWDNRFSNVIWENYRIIPQLDLMKIHHFDNRARLTGLKTLQINMKSSSVQDLPFDPMIALSQDQIDALIRYNIHDVIETEKFYYHSLDMIEFRDKLTVKYSMDFTNHNNTKIGKDYLIKCLEKKMGPLVRKNKEVVQQAYHTNIPLIHVILPCIKFHTNEFNDILHKLKHSVLTNTKNVFDNLQCTIRGFTFHFGTGGIHGSISSSKVSSCKKFSIIDLDVASYYPSLAIINRLYPAHLSEIFCDIYADLKNQRMRYKKGTSENEMLKLALNGVYGDSNNIFSPFYDPNFTMSITINGQLLLCMLAEKILMIPETIIVQINTDGLTIKIPHSLMYMLEKVKNDWVNKTKFQLDQQIYSDMWCKDVNNYIAITLLGDIKRKGAYEYKREWHQNHSMLVVRKAAEAYLVYGTNIRKFIIQHNDKFDFFLSVKISKYSRLMWGEKQVQNITRYYISKRGKTLKKLMPPLKKKPGIERTISINKGWLTTIVNDGEMDWSDVNYDFYVNETKKLTDSFVLDFGYYNNLY